MISVTNKSLALLAFVVALGPGAFATTAQSSSLETTGLAIKSSVSLEHLLEIQPSAAEKVAGDLGHLRDQAGESILSILGPVILHSSQQGNSEPGTVAVSFFKAADDLAQTAKALGIGRPGTAATFNFVVYPTGFAGDVAMNPNDTDDIAFSKNVVKNIESYKNLKFGPVTDGKEPIQPLAAVVSFHLNGEQGEVRLQLINLLNPQKIEGENPISIPHVKKSRDATVMFLEIAQPLAVTLPTAKMTFGKIGSIAREGWIQRFEISQNDWLCSRSNSVPVLWKKQGFWLPLPLYQVRLDFNRTEKIVDADVRLGIFGICTTVFGIVPSQFLAEANQKIDEATTMVSQLLGATPEQLEARIVADRKASGLPTSPGGDADSV